MAYKCVMTVRVHGTKLPVPKYSEFSFATKRACWETLPFYVKEFAEELEAVLGHRGFRITAKAIAAD